MITTLAPASGAPDSVATTVPETVPACCATRGTKQTANRNAAFRAAGVDLTGHLLEDDGVADPGVASNTPSVVGALPVADGSHPGPRARAARAFRPAAPAAGRSDDSRAGRHP